MLREDQVFAARLALAGPWGHVAGAARAPPSRRRARPSGLAAPARRAGLAPARPRDLLQCRELSHWVARSSLDPAQRRRAQAEIAAVLRTRQADQGAPRGRQARADGRSSGPPVTRGRAMTSAAGVADRRPGAPRSGSPLERRASRARRHPRAGRALRRHPPLLPGVVPGVSADDGAVVGRLDDLRPPRRGRVHRALGLLARRRARTPRMAAGRPRQVRPPSGLADPLGVLAGPGLQPVSWPGSSSLSRARAPPPPGRRWSTACWSRTSREPRAPTAPSGRSRSRPSSTCCCRCCSSSSASAAWRSCWSRSPSRCWSSGPSRPRCR